MVNNLSAALKPFVNTWTKKKKKSKSKILKLREPAKNWEGKRFELCISQLLYASAPPFHQDAAKVIRVISMKNVILLGKTSALDIQ